MAATPSPPLLEEITSEENIGDQKKWLVRCVAVKLSGISRPKIRRNLIGSVPKIIYQILGMHKRLRTEASTLPGRLPHEVTRSQTNEP
jgi:hypothetical protein